MNEPADSRSRLGANLALFTVALVVSAIGGEVALRMLGHRGAPQSSLDNVEHVDDPVLDWRYVPRSEIVEGNVVYRFNRAGFRDVDHQIARSPSTQRILVLGDSVTEGRGVPWEQVFSPRLQELLGADFEVITIAQGGLNTPQEIHLLEKVGLDYEPDLVILNFVLNDCDFYTRLRAAQEYTKERDSEIGLLFGMSIDPRVKIFLKSSALVYFLKERLEELQGRLSGENQDDYHVAIWSSTENREKVRAGFDDLQALRAAHGFDVVVVIWPLLTRYDEYPFEEIHEWVREQAESRGFPTVDLLPHYAPLEYRNLQVTPADGVHPNGRGHQIAAETLMAWLRER